MCRASNLLGPVVWDNVDSQELQRVALNVCTHAVPSNDAGETASRLAMQAAALESDNQDPLGQGRIDTTVLGLARYERTGSRARPGPKPELNKRHMFARRRSAERAEAAGKAVKNNHAAALLTGSSDLTLFRTKILPTSSSFDAVLYLALVHGDTEVDDLRSGCANLHMELSERTGQLKALVKENFERFISCKTTIDDIHIRLRKAEGDGADGANGASTADMGTALVEVRLEANKALGAMLERATMSERIKSVLSLLKRYESLFALPMRMRQQMQRQEYDQVISGYRKASALLKDMTVKDPHGVWNSLFLEVEKQVQQMAVLLSSVVQSPASPSGSVVEAVKHLLQLRADGAACAEQLDPVHMCLQSKAQHIRDLMDTCSQEHARRLHSHQQRAQEQYAEEQRWKQLQAAGGQEVVDVDILLQPIDSLEQHGVSTTLEGQHHSAATETLWLRHVGRTVSAVASNLPDLWLLPQEKLAALANVSSMAQKQLQQGREAAAVLIEELLADFRERMTAAFQGLSGPGSSSTTLLAAVAEVVAGSSALQREAAPQAVHTAFTQVLQQVITCCTHQLAAEYTAVLEGLIASPDWETLPVAHSRGHAWDSMPGRLQPVLVRGLEQVVAVHQQAAAGKLSTDGACALELRAAFFGCFSAAAEAIQQMAEALQAGEEQPGEEAEGQQAAAEAPDPEGLPAVPPAGRLLVLLSNSMHLRTQVMPALQSRYEDLLGADEHSDELSTLQQTGESSLQQVESQLATAYCDSKAQQLDALLQEMLAEEEGGWARAPLPTGVRDCTMELLFALDSQSKTGWHGVQQGLAASA
eukprot:jgi/Astpho2/8851/fgenesh1_pg.00129_%23_37_t